MNFDEKIERVEKAQKQLQEFLADPETRAIWDLLEKAERERMMDLAYEFKKGFKEGFIEIREKRAKKMLAEGVDIEVVKQLTDINEEELDKMADEKFREYLKEKEKEEEG